MILNYLLEQLHEQLNKNETKETEKIKGTKYEVAAKIFFDLYSHRSSVALIESKFDIAGQIFSRHVSRRTIFHLTWIYVLIGFGSLFLSLKDQCIYIIFFLIIFPVLIWGFLPRILLYYIAKQYKKKTEVLDEKALIIWIKNHLEGGDEAKNPIIWGIWWRLVTISPFSIKTLWMWVIIFGIFSGYFEEPINPSNGKLVRLVDNIVLTKFAVGFLRTIILSIVSYIATNIIADLIDLKDEYIKGKNKIQEKTEAISYIAGQLQEKISSSKEQMDEIIGEIKTKRFFEPLQVGYEDFLKENFKRYNSQDNVIVKSFEQYSVLLSSQIRLLATNLTGDPVIDLWTLTGLKSAEKLRIKQIKDTNSITTLFEVFGNIIADCLSNIDNDKMEIYTVFALSPDRFLNYNGNDQLSDYWEEYLKKNIEAVNNRLQIHRHFLSFNNSLEEIKEIDGEEGMDLRFDTVNRRLQEPYLVNNAGETSLQKYRKWDGLSIIDKGMELKTLENILASKYHCEQCCKLIKVDLSKGLTKNIIYSEKYKKPIDYFALKSKHNNQWVFCFKAYYDNGLKVAIVEFWHDNVKNKTEWEEIKMHLNALFLSEINGDIEIITLPIVN